MALDPQLRLSPKQKAIVEFGDGPLLVVAGPGTGKTRVLTERVRRLLSIPREHFRVLALTFTNKAAREMQERLEGLADLQRRAFIGTTHGFCLEMLSERGKPLGIASSPQIFEQYSDRKQVLVEAVSADPLLSQELNSSGDAKARNQRLDQWLRAISTIKNRPLTLGAVSDPLERRILDAYTAGLHASGAFDFDDLLLLAYRLLTESEKIAAFYRRVYRYICVDEAQDLNEAQYAVIRALCGTEFKNVMMVGDPNQSIYGFTTSSPQYMQDFERDFTAERIALDENYRSSRVVVDVARALEPSYSVNGQLPIPGKVSVLVGTDEKHEALLVADEISRLCVEGHPDIEGGVSPASCAVLGRTRYQLLAVEEELAKKGIPHYKRVAALHENESDAVEDFQLAMRVYVNPRDQLHLAALLKRWNSEAPLVELANATQVTTFLSRFAGAYPRAAAVVRAISLLETNGNKLNLGQAVAAIREYADSLPKDEKRTVYDDTEVILREFDQYLRASSTSRSLSGFLSSMALGTSQQPNADGAAALLTVHSSKGLEFPVVFIVGMVEGVFPDYRAQGKPKELAEEKRNAFVAVTRSRRLLYLSYAKERVMPWGDTWVCRPSPFLAHIKPYI